MENWLTVFLAVTQASERLSGDNILLRLNGGIQPNQGRVEVIRGTSTTEYEQWGSVCDNGFGTKEARVVCRQLGYWYSRVENGIYKDMGADFVLADVICNGAESNIMACAHSDWGTHNCYATSNSNAGVCCSNSSQFGVEFQRFHCTCYFYNVVPEIKDDLFVSHCAKTWIDAERACETHNSTIASTNLGSVRQLLAGQMWTSRVFTPWMWANGCYRSERESGHQEYILPDNSPGACFLLCNAKFGLSGHACACIDDVTETMTEVEPGLCNTPCPGTADDLCGHESSHYSLYSVVGAETGDIFQQYTAPQARRQCAVLLKSEWKWQLHTRRCDAPTGYVCSRLGMKPLVLVGDMERNSTMESARQQCRDAHGSMRLAGKEIVSTTLRVHGEVSMWVDLSRTQFEGGMRHVRDNVTSFEAEWCVSTRKLAGEQIQYTIVACKQRMGFICQKRIQPSPSQSVFARTTRGSTDDFKTSSVRSVQPTTATDFEKHVVFHVSLIIGSTLLAMVLLVLLFCWCCRTGKKTDRIGIVRYHRNSNPTNNSTVSDILTTEQPVYAEAFPNTENTYDVMQDTYVVITSEELQQKDVLNRAGVRIHDEADINNTTTGSDIRIYNEYSNPVDKVVTDGQVGADFSLDDEHKYMYPFDAITRPVSGDSPYPVDKVVTDGKVGADFSLDDEHKYMYPFDAITRPVSGDSPYPVDKVVADGQVGADFSLDDEHKYMYPFDAITRPVSGDSPYC